ncbi:uncharacterized protein EV422DRAFT_571320 [Fimicolochytrium jonesii]|uniref:uncharacterized protein n=1 Tax=Fimicolochytrium jonesii TaxID=1396493 RepID=UPI0022FE5EAD|nr:uncharacterized protein EV422DRAFT_571320 [Fimicolochytrium jonesii]KAI8816794.1 hypothetical protein EV422DRAFT_571320 [Fimicolochytrium jonesii]
MSADSASETGKVSQVCFIVHGMGRQRRYVENMASLRKGCKEVLKEEFADEDSRVAWIPIEWHQELHALDSVDRRMNSITLPTCSILRAINNDILADVLYYFSSYHGQTILDIIVRRLNQAYDDFLVEHPDFDGHIVLIGHSLGGVICYDLLSNIDDPANSKPASTPDRERSTHFPLRYPQLKFRPGALFMLGSPIGAVLTMRGQSPLTYHPPPEIQFQNIFHLYDPLAYRIEPLFDPRYVEVGPVCLQRPSARIPTITYYRNLFFSQLPDLSTMPAMPAMPTMPTMPAMPTMPPNIISQLQLPRPSLPLPTLDFFKGHMPSLWAASGFWSENIDMAEEAARVAAADNAEAGWLPRKRRRLDGDTLSPFAVEIQSDGDEGTSLHQRSSRKRKRRAVSADVEDMQSGPTDLGGRPPRRKPRRPRRNGNGNENGRSAGDSSVTPPPQSSGQETDPLSSARSYASSVADMVMKSIKSLSSGSAGAETEPTVDPSDSDLDGLAPDDDHQQSDNDNPGVLGTTRDVVDELVGREEALRLVANDLSHAHDRPYSAGGQTNGTQPEDQASDRPEHFSPPPDAERKDFYVQDNIIDNVFQQYLSGLRAHFSYWSNMNVMHHILVTTLKAPQGEQGQSSRTPP